MVETADNRDDVAVGPDLATTPMGRHILSVLMLNQPAVLAHVCSSLGSRDYNIDCMAVSQDVDPSYSRVTVLMTGNSERIELARKRLECLVNVMKADNITTTARVAHLEKAMSRLLDEINNDC